MAGSPHLASPYAGSRRLGTLLHCKVGSACVLEAGGRAGVSKDTYVEITFTAPITAVSVNVEGNGRGVNYACEAINYPLL